MSALISSLPVVFGVALYLVVLHQGLVQSPVLVTPQDYQDMRVKAAPVGAGQFPPDLAWPYYPVRQAIVDLAEVRKNLHENYLRTWRWPRDAFFRGQHGKRLVWWIFFPIPVTVIYFLLVGGLSAWFCYGVYWLVTTGVAGGNMVIFGAAEAVMRSAERHRRTTRHAQAPCMHCFHMTEWPAYRCPGCARLHHDVRPSRLGLITRRCACGTHIPMMASRAAWHLTAVCKRCERPLPEGTGAVRDIDLLRKTGLELPTGSGSIAAWLKRVGMYNLVVSTQREFAEVRFFTVASQDVAADRADDPGAPLSWLLRACGVQLPGDDPTAEPPANPAAPVGART